jgi:asparagine N-glycosylation enzyme membrane subunit Stt3
MKQEIKSRRFEALSNDRLLSFVSGSTATFVAGSGRRITYYYAPESSVMNSLKYRELLDTISSFSSLEPNWDSYGADAISEISIATATKVLNHLRQSGNLPEGVEAHVFPMRNGGIQFDFDSSNSEAELEIDASGEMHFIGYDDQGDVKEEEQLKTYELDELTSLLEESIYA